MLKQRLHSYCFCMEQLLESECRQTIATDADTVRTFYRRAMGPGLHGGVKM